MPISALTKIGISKEASWGAGGAPTYCLPVEPPTFTPTFDQILDNSLRGIAAQDFGAWQGPGHVEASLGGPVYPTEIGLLLAAMFGSETLGDVGTPRAHTFKLASSVPSLAVLDDAGVQKYSYRGLMASELSFSFNFSEGLLTWSASLIGKDFTTSTDAVPSDATEAPFRGWHGSASLGTAGAQIMEGDLTFAREVALVYGGDGLQYPAAAYAGPMAVTGSLTLDFQNTTDVTRYTSRTGQETLTLTFSYGSGESARSLAFTLTTADFGEDAVELDRSGTHVTLGYSFRGIYNTTDSGPAQVVLTNALQTTY